MKLFIFSFGSSVTEHESVEPDYTSTEEYLTVSAENIEEAEERLRSMLSKDSLGYKRIFIEKRASFGVQELEHGAILHTKVVFNGTSLSKFCLPMPHNH
jgi:hypothetical protein